MSERAPDRQSNAAAYLPVERPKRSGGELGAVVNALTTSAGRNAGAGQGAPQVNAAIGTRAAQADMIAGGEVARARVEEELQRLQRENRRLYRAALKYLEAEDEYNRARKEQTE